MELIAKNFGKHLCGDELWTETTSAKAVSNREDRIASGAKSVTTSRSVAMEQGERRVEMNHWKHLSETSPQTAMACHA